MKTIQPAHHNAPSLFRQIAVRLVAFAVLFALINIGIVIYSYSRQPQTLAQELLDLEASRISLDMLAASSPEPESLRQAKWTYTLLGDTAISSPVSSTTETPALIDWTKRERVDGGYRITGLRSFKENGTTHWVRLQFYGQGLSPYLGVIGKEIIQHVALPLAPLSILLLAFNVLAVRDVLKPLFQAEQQANTMAADEPGQRLHISRAPREVNALVQALNGAFERNDRSVSTLKDFTGFAAHELRTPLSIMLLTTEKLPPSDIRASLQRDVRDMSRLVGQLLELAQAEALTFADPPRVDLAEIGSQVVLSLRAFAETKNQTLAFEDFGSSIATVHPEAASRIYRNLIENAIAHAPSDRPIHICAGPGPVLSVRDYGPGIPLEDKEKIFNRFWQGGTRSEGGAGLGLGIVKRLCDAHDAVITLESPEGGGTLFLVQFQPPTK